MMRIQRQASSRRHSQFSIRCLQVAASTARAAGMCLIIGLLGAIAAAQSTSQLNGAATDASGAAVAGAKITLTSTATGAQRTTESNASGLYQFLDVPPGDYKLEANASGFAPFAIEKVTLLVKLPSTVNIHFDVAGGKTSVTVEGEAPLINRTDASLGNVVDGEQLAELPIPDRNVVSMLSLQPGVAYLGNQLDQDTDTRSGAVNGLRSDQSNVTLDGIGVNDQNNGYAFTSVLNVPPDSVEEFRVTTANANADSGYSSGAQVSLVTKSGTNKFHGSAYEYNRNTAFSANDPFLKEADIVNNQPNTRPELLRNVFGVTFGGPIKKDRLFFFANYEGRRDAEGTSVERIVPTAALRAGVVQYLCPLGPVGQLDTTDCPGSSSNGVIGLDGNTYTPPPGYWAMGIVPSGQQGAGTNEITAIDPNGIGTNPALAQVLGQYPLPNQTNVGDGVNTLGYRFASNAKSSYNTYLFRGDYHINSTGSETLFWRGELQYYKIPGQQQFPGQSASSTQLDDSKGSTVGLNSLISSNLINDFHWGWIRQGGQVAGVSQYPGVFLSGIDNLVPFTRSNIYFVPVNQFSDTLTWTHKNHTFAFGTDLFIIRNNRTSYLDSYSDVQTNPVYLNTGGISEPNNPSPLNPVNNTNPTTGQPYTAVDQSFASNYDTAIALALGIFAEGDGIYNYDHSGNALAQGAPVQRRYAVNDYEFYGQDNWRVTPRLTLTYGLRWVLEAPPYETNGLQVAPCVQATSGGCTNQNVADWFNHTAQLMSQGQPAINAGEITYTLGGPVNHGPGLWNWDKKDFSPRLAMAWAPDTGDGWLSKVFGKKDQFTVRAGYSIVYDHFGIPIVNSFDQHGSFGLSTDLGDPAGVITVQGAPRFTCLVPGTPAGTAGQSCLPQPCAVLQGPSCLFGPTPSGTFPVTPSNQNFAINWGLDQSVKTPYSHVFNFSLQRQISSKSSLQVAYVGTVARRLPMQVDLAMPANQKDPASNTTYFQAAQMLSMESAAGTSIAQVAPVPFFENYFPAWAGASVQSALATVNQSQQQPYGDLCATPNGSPLANPTATQNVYQLWTCNLHNETFALFLMDLPNAITGMPTPNSKNGPYEFYHDQFSSLYAWRNIGTSNYNALQVTYNARFGASLQGQFNYTFSKSIDEASAAERVGPYEGTGGTGSDLNGGGIVINAWSPLSLRGPSDFNATHQINGNLVYTLPIGRNHALLGGAGPLVNEFVGGWNVSGVFRWTSGFPITVDNGPAWATDWNIEGDAEPNGPLPQMHTTKNAYIGCPSACKYVGPDMFVHPDLAQGSFRQEWPGESGVRNNVIGDGMFDIDTGVSKNFSLGEGRRLEFSWQAFNATNSVRYDVRSAQPSLGEAVTQFGAYTKTITTPRFMQFALRFVF